MFPSTGLVHPVECLPPTHALVSGLLKRLCRLLAAWGPGRRSWAGEGGGPLPGPPPAPGLGAPDARTEPPGRCHVPALRMPPGALCGPGVGLCYPRRHRPVLTVLGELWRLSRLPTRRGPWRQWRKPGRLCCAALAHPIPAVGGSRCAVPAAIRQSPMRLLFEVRRGQTSGISHGSASRGVQFRPSSFP